jgi:hypothetical protein
VVECLPTKVKALSSNLSTETKEKEKKNQTGGMAQEIEHLPSKCGALSSNPSATKKKFLHASIQIFHSSFWRDFFPPIYWITNTLLEFWHLKVLGRLSKCIT